MTPNRRLSEFEFTLPDELIAKTPLKNRQESRLMVVSLKTGQITHAQFRDLPHYLNPNTVMVFNNTKVLKARLFATRETGGKIELLLLKSEENNTVWECMLSPARALKVGEKLRLSETTKIEILDKGNESRFPTVKFQSSQPVEEILETHGLIPLPPYMDISPQETNQFEKNYQTMFAAKPGAVAAPTAGLHFTPDILEILAKKGIGKEEITLHVGYGTFAPIKTDALDQHQMHSETYHIEPEVADALTKAKKEGSAILGVGTTVVRTLESAWDKNKYKSGTSQTRLFITPGYEFKGIDAMLTNFHLPKSTLLVLISAFAGMDLIKKAYQEAIAQKYRFYSFGDAMLLIP